MRATSLPIGARRLSSRKMAGPAQRAGARKFEEHLRCRGRAQSSCPTGLRQKNTAKQSVHALEPTRTNSRSSSLRHTQQARHKTGACTKREAAQKPTHYPLGRPGPARPAPLLHRELGPMRLHQAAENRLQSNATRTLEPRQPTRARREESPLHAPGKKQKERSQAIKPVELREAKSSEAQVGDCKAITASHT